MTYICVCRKKEEFYSDSDSDSSDSDSDLDSDLDSESDSDDYDETVNPNDENSILHPAPYIKPPLMGAPCEKQESLGKLTAEDLLPSNKKTLWSNVAPSVPTLKDKNFLVSNPSQLGINTVGQSMRNSNLQIRSEPTNPQVKVSPWMMSTIHPDTYKNGLC